MLLHSRSFLSLDASRLDSNYAVICIHRSQAREQKASIYDTLGRYNYEHATCHGVLFVNIAPKMDATKYFTERHASAITMFFHSMRELDVENLYIQCDTGLFIAPAIVAALHKYVGDEELHDQTWLDPKVWVDTGVYETMCSQYNLQLPQGYINSMLKRSSDEYDRVYPATKDAADEHLYY